MDEEFLENLGDEDFFDNQINAMMDEMTSNTFIFIGIGVGTWICGWVQGTILMIVSTRITNRLRIKVPVRALSIQFVADQLVTGDEVLWVNFAARRWLL